MRLNGVGVGYNTCTRVLPRKGTEILIVDTIGV